VRLEGKDRLPVCDPETLESNVPGIYLAGVIVAGMRTNEIFIENGRFHGRQIADDLALKLELKLALNLDGSATPTQPGIVAM
jgi:thioredoxin reductase (NADPH)